jgi:hypothetical protein
VITVKKRFTEAAADDIDEFVPDRKVRAELGGIAHMTMYRYDRDPRMAALGWPPLVRIGSRKYRSRKQLERFKAAMVKRAVAERDGEAA